MFGRGGSATTSSDTNAAGDGLVGEGGDASGGTSNQGGKGIFGRGGNGDTPGLGVFGIGGNSTTQPGGIGGQFIGGTSSSGSSGIGIEASPGPGPSLGLAGLFLGNVFVTGNLSKGSGTFTIDHPLHPEHKFLNHSFVEAPEMLTVYRGRVTLDNNGRALVRLPDYFEALNRDFDYQLTPVGAAAPSLYIEEEIKDNQFWIAGGTPDTKVSWMVTGVRHDPYAENHPIQVEQEKTPEQVGKYLHPEAYGKSDQDHIYEIQHGTKGQVPRPKI